MNMPFNKRPATPSPAASPERSALREALAKRDSRSAEIAAIAKAIVIADDAVRVLRTARDEADAAVDTAKTNAAAFLVETALGEAGEPPMTIRAARAAALSAQDDLEAAEAALTALRGRLEPLKQHAHIGEDHVRLAAAAVLRTAPGVATLVAEVDALQKQLAAKGGALLWLAEKDALDLTNIESPGRSEFNSAHLALARCQSPLGTWTALAVDGAAPWRAALSALQSDANAVLPV